MGESDRGARDDLEIRAATPADLPAVLDLLRVSMARGDDERFERLFRWKHHENAFGPSPAWVATDAGRVVAVRYLMRWQWRRGADRLAAVRAVDTATHPEYQGRGLFTRLTRHALDELAGSVDFVFNTPNDQSRPGYLKMGWQVVGRLRPAVMPCSLGGLTRAMRSRVPAEHWSAPTRAGIPAAEALADGAAIDSLLAARAQPSGRAKLSGRAKPSGRAQPSGRAERSGLETVRDLAFLRWRYAAGPLEYRAIAAGGGSLAIVRVRTRGTAREGVLAEVLAPDRRSRSDLLQRVRKELDADYLLTLGVGNRGIPMARQGPILTWRSIPAQRGIDTQDPAPALDQWHVTLGDIEVF